MSTLLSHSTVVDLLRHRATQQPTHTALIFLDDGGAEAVRLTYEAIDQQAQVMAAHLQERLSPGERALLIYPYEAGAAFVIAFLGCLYAGVVAVPCHPPRSRSACSDVQARLTSAQATTVLTTHAALPKLKRQLAEVDGLCWLTTDRLAALDRAWTAPELDGETLAFLQYTSGSTGIPKGVMVTHSSLLHNQQVLQRAFGHTSQSIGVGWLPLFHDMGLIGNVLQALYLGASCVLMSPIAFIQKPLRWLQAISRYQATTSGAPNFAYDLLCRQVTEEQMAQLDLSPWQVAFTGAEPVRPETIDRFAAKFAACGFRKAAFYPCYGMAEATLFVSGGERLTPPRTLSVRETPLEQHRVVLADQGEHDRVRSLVSCGRAWLDGTITIVDPDSRITCAADRVGEIWVSGSGLGRGYWNQPDETERTFRAQPSDTQEGCFLRTGDLGFLHDGELFITGRLHDVMVFWGFNHYPQQIEQTIAHCHPAFRENAGAAIAVPIAGSDRLVIIQEVDRQYRDQLMIQDVVEAIRWAVFQEHFLDVYAIVLLKPGSLPKTSSGKIQRQRCRTLFLNDEFEALDQWRSPQPNTDIPTMIQRYLNPMVHLKRYSAQMNGQLRRRLYNLLYAKRL